MPTARIALALVLLLGAAGLPAPAAAQHMLSVGSASGQPDESVELPLTYTGSGGAVAMQLDLLFDPDLLTLDKVTDGADLGAHLARHHEVAAGRLRLVLHARPTAPVTDGEMARLVFDIAPSAPDGPTPLTLAATVLSNADAMVLGDVDLVAGSVEISTAVAPTVSFVGSVPATEDGLLTPGEATLVALTQLLVGFSDEILDPAGNGDPDDVTNPQNYLLVADGPTAGLSTQSCIEGAGLGDTQVPIGGVSYDPLSRIAVLQIAGPALTAGHYRLLVCGSTSIVGGNGQPLDGDGDGSGGDDYRLEFRVLRNNLLFDPNFDQDLAGWTATTPGSDTFLHDPADAEDAPSSGSAGLDSGAAQGSPIVLHQCVAVAGGRNYGLGGLVRVASPLAGDPVVFADVRFYAGDGCTGALVAASTGEAVVGDTGDVWQPLPSLLVTAHANARSAEVRFVVDVSVAPSFGLDFDHLSFFEDSLLFRDGFETGSTSHWSRTVP